jgi:hypothetical protein
MAGFMLEFKRLYNLLLTRRKYELFQIGHIDGKHVHDFTGERGLDSNPRGELELVASQIAPPRINQNLLDPVNDVSNVEAGTGWTLGIYVHLLTQTDNKPSVSGIDYGFCF